MRAQTDHLDQAVTIGARQHVADRRQPRSELNGRRAGSVAGSALAACDVSDPKLKNIYANWRSSRRARDIWWTSSGPSAMRSMRACAYSSARGKSWLTPAPPWAWIA